MAIQPFLDTLTDTELAFVYRNRAGMHLPETQAALQRELEKRNMSIRDVKAILKKVTFNKKNVGCARCNTQRRSGGGHCIICGWGVMEEEERRMPLWRKALRLAGSVLRALTSAGWS
jgi:hypothetical protein